MRRGRPTKEMTTYRTSELWIPRACLICSVQGFRLGPLRARAARVINLVLSHTSEDPYNSHAASAALHPEGPWQRLQSQFTRHACNFWSRLTTAGRIQPLRAGSETSATGTMKLRSYLSKRDIWASYPPVYLIKELVAPPMPVIPIRRNLFACNTL